MISNLVRHVIRVLHFFSKKERLKLSRFLFVQLLSNLLDLLGIALISVLTYMAVSRGSGISESKNISSALNLFGISSIPFTHQVLILMMVAFFVLVSKTVLTVVISSRTFLFLGKKSADVSRELLEDIFRSDLIKLNSKTTQEYSVALTQGTQSLFVDLIGYSILAICEVSLLILIFLALLAYNPIVALMLVGYFSLIIWFMLKLNTKKARLNEIQRNYLRSRNLASVQNLFSLVYELRVSNNYQNYTEQFRRNRIQEAKATSNLQIIGLMPKYILEIALLLGIALIGGTSYLLGGVSDLLLNLTIFLIASSRMMPSLLRLQTAITQAWGAVGSGEVAYVLLEGNFGNHSNSFLNSEFGDEVVVTSRRQVLSTISTKEIEVKGLCLRYPGSKFNTLKNVDLKVVDGEFVSIVGDSGSGKTSILNILAGLIEPSSGSVTIGGFTPIQRYAQLDTGISYIPQRVTILDETILQNVALGNELEEIDFDLVNWALGEVGLIDWVNELPKKSHSVLGERGANLSGGQQQRIGLARALYSDAEIILLDEPTSSLDSSSERLVTDTLVKLKGQKTLVLVSHRLNTIQQSDKILLLVNGVVSDQGTFDELSLSSPDFRKYIQDNRL